MAKKNQTLKYSLYILGGGLLAWGIYEMLKPIGVQMNNPGNLKKNDSSLQTYAALLDPIQDNPTYLKFVDQPSGIRGMAHLLLTYNGMGILTVTDIISKYAPPSENDTTAYIQFIVDQTGLSPTIPFHFGQDSLERMVQSMITYEQGWNWVKEFIPYIPSEVANAIKLYPNLA